MSYCKAVINMESGNPNIKYHNEEYGFPLNDDNALFGRLILEINQAGLSWTTILKKSDSFYRAYDEFDVSKVAKYNNTDILRLMSDGGIIRNSLKINAAIHNANRILVLQKEYGSFKNWLDKNHPLTKVEWVKIFKKQDFKFIGGEIVNEFLMSSGYLKGAHDEDCPVFKIVEKHKPKWMINPL